MTVANLAPPIKDKGQTKTLAFPFQKGPTGFPALAAPGSEVYAQINALLNTAKGERVMNYSYGIDIYRYNFTNMTAIDKMRLASTITRAIETFVSGVKVNRVIPGKLEYVEGVGTHINIDVWYEVAGTQYTQQVITIPTSQGA